jgi:hypothetical protein
MRIKGSRLRFLAYEERKGPSLSLSPLSPAADKSASHDLPVGSHVQHGEKGKGQQDALGHIQKLKEHRGKGKEDRKG